MAQKYSARPAPGWLWRLAPPRWLLRPLPAGSLQIWGWTRGALGDPHLLCSSCFNAQLRLGMLRTGEATLPASFCFVFVLKSWRWNAGPFPEQCPQLFCFEMVSWVTPAGLEPVVILLSVPQCWGRSEDLVGGYFLPLKTGEF